MHPAADGSRMLGRAGLVGGFGSLCLVWSVGPSTYEAPRNPALGFPWIVAHQSHPASQEEGVPKGN